MRTLLVRCTDSAYRSGVSPEKPSVIGMSSFRPGYGRLLRLALPLIVIVVAVASGVYTVPSDSVAVVQRFGTYLKDVEPGLHIKIPFGIDMASIVPVKRQLKQE